MNRRPMNSRQPDLAFSARLFKVLTSLLGLIVDRNWDEFEQAALTDARVFKFISRELARTYEFNGMTLLHVCARCDPPHEVIARMIELYPRALAREDSMGRTPLHVAAATGASARAIECLTAGYPEACAVRDSDGRTPLHFACDTECEMFDEELDAPRGPPGLETVRVLLRGSPDSVTLEDEDGMNAVEYAILSDAPLEVVQLLQRTMQRVIARREREKADGPPPPASRSIPASRINVPMAA